MAFASWSLEEMERSSTFRELQATWRVPESEGSKVLHRTDNKNTEIILSIGSRKADLHDEAVSIYKLCRAYDIHLTVEWVSHDYNVVADELLRIEDANDYMLDRSCFMSLDRLWGPHLVDRFASEKTNQLERFCHRFLNPGCEAADAFTGFPCLLWASRFGKLCSACYGQESVSSWVIHLPLLLLPEFGPYVG